MKRAPLCNNLLTVVLTAEFSGSLDSLWEVFLVCFNFLLNRLILKRLYELHSPSNEGNEPKYMSSRGLERVPKVNDFCLIVPNKCSTISVIKVHLYAVVTHTT
jgi:hypothetical protein